MHVICLKPLAPGVYNDHCADHITAPPDGWAYIPEDFPLPSTFPRLGSIEAEELTYTREVEVEKEVTKTREIDSFDEEGNPVKIQEDYTEMETVTEEQEYTMLTVTAMTEGTLPEPDTEQLATEARAKRDKLLAETDWTQVADAPIDTATRTAMRVYRQQLRDITEQAGFPTDIVWPEMPTIVKATPEPIDEVVEAIIGVEVTA
jgi:hypothetical protein